MYGLVNQALEDFVRRGFGDAAWKQIRDNAGVNLEMFVSMDSYPDEVTYKLVGAATEVLNLDAARILEAFGEHWVLYTAQAGYGEMLAMFESNLRTLLFNLDSLHSHGALASITRVVQSGSVLSRRNSSMQPTVDTGHL